MDEIDVILPVGQNHKYLKAAIDSVHNSLGVRTRLIVIDNTETGLKDLGALIKKNDVIVREPIRGFASAINASLADGLVVSDFTAIMNSDDICHPLRFISQINVLKHTSTQLNICRVQNFRGNNLTEPFFGEFEYSFYHPLLLAYGAYGIEPTWCAISSWWIKNSKRDTLIHPDVVDLECGMRVFPHTQISTVPKRLYFYRKHRKQMSRQLAIQKNFVDIFPIAEYFFNSYGIELPNSRTFYLSRPRNLFQEKFTWQEKRAVAIFLEHVRSRILAECDDKRFRNELDKVIAIRLNSKISSFGRLIRIRSLSVFNARVKTDEIQ
jgi:glycosyltransferase involved in cell wall biosynthesis